MSIKVWGGKACVAALSCSQLAQQTPVQYIKAFSFSTGCSVACYHTRALPADSRMLIGKIQGLRFGTVMGKSGLKVLFIRQRAMRRVDEKAHTFKAIHKFSNFQGS